MTLEEKIEAFVIANDRKFFLEKTTMSKAAKAAREAGVPGSLKVIQSLIKPARTDLCVFWGKRLKPELRLSVMPDAYWEKLRDVIRRQEHVLCELTQLQASMVIRISIGTNMQLMNGLTKRYHVWK